MTMEHRREVPSHLELFGAEYEVLPPREYYSRALVYALKVYPDQLSRYRECSFSDLTPVSFYYEYVWCVYVSGFSAHVVSAQWEGIKRVLTNNRSDMLAGAETASYDAMAAIFDNKRKFQACVDTAIFLNNIIAMSGWQVLKEDVLSDIEKLQKFPMIGPVTSNHLARNIGHDSVKPDLHIMRLIKFWTRKRTPEAAQAFLFNFAEEVGERPGVVDYVFWTYATDFGTKDVEEKSRGKKIKKRSVPGLRPEDAEETVPESSRIG